MNNLTEVVPSIHRLVIPFLDIFTTVFVVKTPEGSVLLDTATYPTDIDEYIVPALNELGVSADDLKYVVISHSHRDHAGGLERFSELYPNTCIVSRSDALCEKFSGFTTLCPEDNHQLMSDLSIITIPGHAPDCVGLYDARTRTLLTGDCLQLYGIYGSGAWGANIGMPAEHLAALDKLRTLDIDTIYASHNYHPCDYQAHGKEEIEVYLSKCAEALQKIHEYLLTVPQLDDEAASEQYNKTSGLPTVQKRIFTSLRTAAAEGRLPF